MISSITFARRVWYQLFWQFHFLSPKNLCKSTWDNLDNKNGSITLIRIKENSRLKKISAHIVHISSFLGQLMEFGVFYVSHNRHFLVKQVWCKYI